MTTTQLHASSRSGADGLVWLRRFLALDAVVTAVNGLLYLVASEPLERLLDVGGGLLPGLGVFLALYGMAVGYVAGRPRPPVPAVQAVIETNLVWVVLSIVALVFWFDDPSTAGQVWIPLQAVTVGGFAVLQYTALRRSRT
ncbi:hypothetical protein FDG2_4060 [Candidatus Protofrankia californiensis]|uniref:Integral membrane protein n=1 Tax=Candidatus Protofrankia californiensis TaxID=1839754 RepID=A0A1C3P2Y7_9ACTN|nr:hypothetical protein FDG2_4060 [Candidatus Protofrankia californiensis]